MGPVPDEPRRPSPPGSAPAGPGGDPERVLLAGDWHGNAAWAEACTVAAAEAACPVVLQLGDFGLWPGRADAYLDHVDAAAQRAGVAVVWIDGNHEDHDALDRWRDRAGPGGLVAMRPSVTWAPRGARWSWGAAAFGALGGAVSIDRFLRRPGVNWWPQEAVTPADVERLGDDPLDVLVTHAAPAAVAFPVPPRLRLPPAIVADARAGRALLDDAVRRTRPRLVVHGHHHVRYRTEVGGVRYEGVGHDKGAPADAVAVLDLAAGLTIN